MPRLAENQHEPSRATLHLGSAGEECTACREPAQRGGASRGGCVPTFAATPGALSRRAMLAALAGGVAAMRPRRLGAQPRASLATVALVPLGEFPAQLLGEITAGLRQELGVTVLPHPPMPLPRMAYYAPRRRYRAERLLDALRPLLRPPVTRMLGVTTVDISTSAHGVSDWGVLGLGDLGGTSCVLSTFRCRMNSPSEAQSRWRMVSTSVHEVGHTLGLPHCPVPRCVMNDARGSVRTVDASTGHLCDACRRHLGL